MSLSAEVKANTVYFLARYLGEPLLAVKLPPYQESAPAFGAVDKTDVFYRAAQNAFVNLHRAQSPQDKAQALVDLAEQATNGSRFSQARLVIKDLHRLSTQLLSPDQEYFQARVYEKLGWLADYETGYGEALRDFSTARRLVERIDRDRWGDKHQDLHSTTTHFLGRARLGLACQGIDPRYNLEVAKGHFVADLRRFQVLREQGQPKPANEGFQHLWLAACHLTANNLAAVSAELHQAGDLIGNSASGIKAHWYLIDGLLKLREGNSQVAREDFLEAVRIRTQVEKYPLGLALAEMGIAKTYFQEKQIIPVLAYMRKAIQAQPVVLLYTLNGRPTA